MFCKRLRLGTQSLGSTHQVTHRNRVEYHLKVHSDPHILFWSSITSCQHCAEPNPLHLKIEIYILSLSRFPFSKGAQERAVQLKEVGSPQRNEYAKPAAPPPCFPHGLPTGPRGSRLVFPLARHRQRPHLYPATIGRSLRHCPICLTPIGLHRQGRS